MNKEEKQDIRAWGRLVARAGLHLRQEFSSPLAQLITPLEEIIATESNPHRAEQLRLALKNAYRFHSLVNLLEEIAAVEAGATVFALHKSDIVSFSKNLVNSFSGVAKAKNIDLRFRSSYQSLECYYDYHKLRRILYSLLANAIRYSNKEESEITVTIQLLNGTHFLLLTVADNGVGIQADKLPHLTDPFYDDPLHLRLYQSTSLGLYLVKRLLDLLGGKIEFYSKKERGTIVEVHFPVFMDGSDIPFEKFSIDDQLVPELLQLSEHIREVDTYEIIDYEPKTVSDLPLLLIFQHPEPLPEILLQSLKTNYRVIMAAHHGQALQLTMNHQPDLLLLAAPLDEALEATIHFIKSREMSSHMPLFWLPAGIDRENRKKANELLVDGMSEQSVVAEEILAELQKIILNRKLAYDYSAKKSLKEVRKIDVIPSMTDSFLQRLHLLIDKHLDEENPDMESLSDMMNLSRTQLHRKIKAASGLSTTHYIREYKLRLAFSDIEKGTGTMAEIADKYGFGSLAYFSRSFKKVYGITPTEVNKRKR